jgi:FAD/FMN-containing dehydrogenase
MDRPSGFRGEWRTDDVTRAVYSEAAGIHRLMPTAVAVPADADDVATLTAWAAAEGVALTPRGAGSSMAGGAVGSGVLVDLSRLDALAPVRSHAVSFGADDDEDQEPTSRFDADVAEMDLEYQAVEVGPGVLCDALVAHADAADLLWAHRPSSHAFCTIGGMVATNAAGPRWPHTGDLPLRGSIIGLDCVFADGSRGWVHLHRALPDCAPVARALEVGPGPERVASGLQSSQLRKRSSGYFAEGHTDQEWLLNALIGSEGTLATFVGIDVVLDEPAPATSLLVIGFDDLDAAAEAAAIAVEVGAVACECFDRTFLDLSGARETYGLPEETEIVLLMEVRQIPEEEDHPDPESVEAGFAEMQGVCHLERTEDAERTRALWELRKAASPMLAALPGTVRSMQVIEDGVVPPVQLAKYLRGVRALCEAKGIPVVMFGHALHGNIHANVLVDVTVEGWQAKLDDLFLDVTALVKSLGGLMSGEHGDGRLRAGVMDRLWPAKDMAWFHALKEAMDPQGILNPGVKFAARGAPLLGAPNKYDPALEPLPAVARQVLDRVQGERLWGRNRLDMLGELGS